MVQSIEVLNGEVISIVKNPSGDLSPQMFQLMNTNRVLKKKPSDSLPVNYFVILMQLQLPKRAFSKPALIEDSESIFSSAEKDFINNVLFLNFILIERFRSLAQYKIKTNYPSKCESTEKNYFPCNNLILKSRMY